MTGPSKKKKHLTGKSDLKKKWKTKRKTKDLDEIDFELKKTPENLPEQEFDVDRPGGSQFYCAYCSKYFIDNNALEGHLNKKTHKRRLKALELEPYSIQDSLRAAGMGNYILPKKRKIEDKEIIFT